MLTVDACQRCGEDLTDAACTGHERRTLIDIVFEKVVRHVDAQIKHCARCHTETRACFPHEMPGPLQYGSGIKAYVVHLLIAQMLSLKRVAQSVHALIGQLLSEATLLGYVAQLHHALAEWESHAIERLLAMPAMHVDETSLRVDRKNHWIHVYTRTRRQPIGLIPSSRTLSCGIDSGSAAGFTGSMTRNYAIPPECIKFDPTDLGASRYIRTVGNSVRDAREQVSAAVAAMMTGAGGDVVPMKRRRG